MIMKPLISFLSALRRACSDSFLPNALAGPVIESWMKSAMRRRLMSVSCGHTDGSTDVTPDWNTATPSSIRSAAMPAALNAM